MNRVPELLSNTVITFSLPVAVLLIGLGVISATAGRKFFWLATGLNAFIASYITGSTLMAWPAWQCISAAVVVGLLGALFTIVLKQLSFTLNAFFIFGLLVAVTVIRLLDFGTNSFTPLIVFFVAGSIASFYNLVKPKEALLYTTSFIGAFAMACGLFRLLHRASDAFYLTVLWAVLGIAGSIWQKRMAEKEDRN